MVPGILLSKSGLQTNLNFLSHTHEGKFDLIAAIRINFYFGIFFCKYLPGGLFVNANHYIIVLPPQPSINKRRLYVRSEKIEF